MMNMTSYAEAKISEEKEVETTVYPVTPNRRLSYLFFKRTFDIFASLMGLIVLLPLFLIVAIVIFIDDPGPVLFFQNRIGKGTESFRMLKFRSMVVDAEKLLEKMPEENRKEFADHFKLKDDPRITRIGRFIRKTSIDELPQLINVLLGDMSLVGPRPPLLAEREAYGRHLAAIMSVRPGVTGYWQVHGRSDVSFRERIELNEYYIAHQSIRLDLEILLETVKVVVTKEGAE